MAGAGASTGASMVEAISSVRTNIGMQSPSDAAVVPGNGAGGKAVGVGLDDGLPLPRRYVAIGAISAGTALTIFVRR